MNTSPTKWSLYRSLIRATYGQDQVGPGIASPTSRRPTAGSSAESGVHNASQLERKSQLRRISGQTDGLADLSAIRRSIRERWKQQRGMASLFKAKKMLAAEYQLLDLLNARDARRGDSSTLTTLEAILRKEQATADRIRSRPPPPRRRPRITPGIIEGSKLNPPWPRLVPQPALMAIIMKRRQYNSQIRLDLRRSIFASVVDMHREMRTLEMLYSPSPGQSRHGTMLERENYIKLRTEWKTDLLEQVSALQAMEVLDRSRAETLPSEQLLKDLARARVEKAQHKARLEEKMKAQADPAKSLKENRRDWKRAGKLATKQWKRDKRKLAGMAKLSARRALQPSRLYNLLAAATASKS